MYSSDERLMRSQEGYFGVYNEINTEITLEYIHYLISYTT